MSDKRNYGLDLYRILCCVGVLNYHVMDDVLGKGGGSIFLVFCSVVLCSWFFSPFYYNIFMVNIPYSQ